MMIMLKSSFSKLAMVGVLLVSACGDRVPAGFRGDFVDARTGSKLTLNAESGVFQTTDGRKLEANRMQMDFEDLAKGTPGIYTRQNPKNTQILEIYWIQPDAASRDQAGGMQWFTAEVLFFRMERETDKPVDVLNLVHSRVGTVMLDTPTKQWQIGWPAGSELLEMRRVAR
jgi:hypothetical protein